MNPQIGVKVVDLDRVHAAIDDLKNIDKDKAVKAGLKAATLVFLAGGKRRLRQRMKSGRNGVKGNLLRAFSSRVKRNKPGALAGFRSTRTEDIELGRGGYHAHLVDRGTATRRNYKRKNANRGVMPGNAFWTDTINQDSGKALDKLYGGIERAVNTIKNRH